MGLRLSESLIFHYTFAWSNLKMYHAMNTRNVFLTATFTLLSAVVFAQVEVPEVKPKADSLQMAVDTLLLESVTITAERPLFSVEGEKTLYQVSDDPTVQSGVASDALQNAPGVSVDAEGDITLRGTSSVEIWINDQPSNLTGENLKTKLLNIDTQNTRMPSCDDRFYFVNLRFYTGIFLF